MRAARFEKRFVWAALPYVTLPVGIYVLRNVWVAVGLYYAGIAICWRGRANRGRILAEFGRGLRWRLVGAAAAVSAALFAGLLLIWPYIRHPDTDLGALLARLELTGGVLVMFAVGALLVNPILEEVFWRGCLRVTTPRPHWIDGAFALYHIPVLWLALRWWALPAAFAGLAAASWHFRYLQRRSGGLVTPWLAHLFADLAIAAAIVSIVCR